MEQRLVDFKNEYPHIFFLNRPGQRDPIRNKVLVIEQDGKKVSLKQAVSKKTNGEEKDKSGLIVYSRSF
jgi:hypothetical protein